MSERRPATTRPQSITQHAEMNARQKHEHRIRHQFDTAPGRTAREWFDVLVPRLVDSRPLLKKAIAARPSNGGRAKPAVYGKPTFRNVIENGQHV